MADALSHCVCAGKKRLGVSGRCIVALCVRGEDEAGCEWQMHRRTVPACVLPCC